MLIQSDKLKIAKIITTEIHKKLKENIKFQNIASPPSFSTFPKGCCGNASWILQSILQHYYGINCNVVSFAISIHGLPDSHAWVEIDASTIIDITYGQFDENIPIYYGSGESRHHKYKNEGENTNLTPPQWLDPVAKEIQSSIKHCVCI
ncbi:TPA: hypothetical protein ACNOH1_003866 [Providencia rettgeri]